MTDSDRLLLFDLVSALEICLGEVAQKVRSGEIDDLGEAVALEVFRYLNNIFLRQPPATEPYQYTIPFSSPHLITTHFSNVLRGGLGGGPRIDILLQITYDTESIKTGFGIPILVRRSPSFGAMDPDEWMELRSIAAHLNQFTSAGRLLLFGFPDFYPNRTWKIEKATSIFALSTTLVAGAVTAPRGLSGRQLEHFANDLVSGWVGDTALAAGDSQALDSFLRVFDVANVVTIRLSEDLKR